MIKKSKLNINDSNILHFDKNITTDSKKDTVDGNDKSDNETKNENDLKQIVLELLKKSSISGGPEKIAGEFVKIYNILSRNLIQNEQNINIPKQTVFDDYIICLEDGKKMKMLCRHLKVKYGMSFQEYKQKWGLPIDYPDVCKNYSKVRAEIAKNRKKKRKTKNN